MNSSRNKNELESYFSYSSVQEADQLVSCLPFCRTKAIPNEPWNFLTCELSDNSLNQRCCSLSFIVSISLKYHLFLYFMVIIFVWSNSVEVFQIFIHNTHGTVFRIPIWLLHKPLLQDPPEMGKERRKLSCACFH